MFKVFIKGLLRSIINTVTVPSRELPKPDDYHIVVQLSNQTVYCKVTYFVQGKPATYNDPDEPYYISYDIVYGDVDALTEIELDLIEQMCVNYAEERAKLNQKFKYNSSYEELF